MSSTENDPLSASEDGRCPRCGGVPVPIAYGYPSSETFEAAQRGDVVLGGCLVFDGQPTSRCSGCGAAVGSRR